MKKERIVSLDDLGDLSATPGSEPWAVAVRNQLQVALAEASVDRKKVATWNDLLMRHEGWKRLKDATGHAFLHYEGFCLAKPPFGLGYDRADLDRICKERGTPQRHAAAPRTLLEDHGPPTKKQREEGIFANGKVTKQGSHSTTYLTARIARDRPDILERMKAGEFRSVTAAAVAAGIKVYPTPLESLRLAWKKATEAERQQFLTEIHQT
jgi:hypothetical protein